MKAVTEYGGVDDRIGSCADKQVPMSSGWEGENRQPAFAFVYRLRT